MRLLLCWDDVRAVGAGKEPFLRNGVLDFHILSRAEPRPNVVGFDAALLQPAATYPPTIGSSGNGTGTRREVNAAMVLCARKIALLALSHQNTTPVCS